MTDPIWLSVARMLVGITEIPGPASNPMIVQWARDIGAPNWFHDDSAPWCAVGLNRLMLACQLPLSGSGFDVLRAKSFETWGQALSQPTLGCVLTFERPGGGHCGLYVGERDDAYYVWGCNQSDSVSYTWIKKERCTSARWPLGVPVVESGPVWIIMGGSVSGNEQ